MIKPNKSLSITQTKADTFWFYSSRRRRNYAFWKGWVWHWFQDTPSLLNYLYKDPQRNIYGGFRKKFLKILAHMTLIWWIIIDDDDDDGCGGVSGSSMTDPSLKHFPSAPPYILNSHLHWAAAVQCACALYTVHCTVYIQHAMKVIGLRGIARHRNWLLDCTTVLQYLPCNSLSLAAACTASYWIGANCIALHNLSAEGPASILH